MEKMDEEDDGERRRKRTAGTCENGKKRDKGIERRK